MKEAQFSQTFCKQAMAANKQQIYPYKVQMPPGTSPTLTFVLKKIATGAINFVCTSTNTTNDLDELI